MFMDQDIPFCDIRSDESEVLNRSTCDYPAIIQHYAEDRRRLEPTLHSSVGQISFIALVMLLTLLVK